MLFICGQQGLFDGFSPSLELLFFGFSLLLLPFKFFCALAFFTHLSFYFILSLALILSGLKLQHFISKFFFHFLPIRTIAQLEKIIFSYQCLIYLFFSSDIFKLFLKILQRHRSKESLTLIAIGIIENLLYFLLC